MSVYSSLVFSHPDYTVGCGVTPHQLALADVDAGKIGAVPLYLRNAPTKLMKEWGNHEGYKYAHDWPGAVAPQEYMPEELRGTEYYHPNDRGYEHEVSQRLAKIRPILHGGEPEQK